MERDDAKTAQRGSTGLPLTPNAATA